MVQVAFKLHDRRCWQLRDFEVGGIRRRSCNASDLDSLRAHGSVGSGRRAAEIGTMRNGKVKKKKILLYSRQQRKYLCGLVCLLCLVCLALEGQAVQNKHAGEGNTKPQVIETGADADTCSTNG